jgi:hypothetical protein
MSAEAVIGIIALVLGGLATLLGAAWWMSALYSKVGHIQDNTASTSSKLDTLTDSMTGEFHDVRSVQRQHQSDITDLKLRVVRIEGVLDTETE